MTWQRWRERRGDTGGNIQIQTNKECRTGQGKGRKHVRKLAFKVKQEVATKSSWDMTTRANIILLNHIIIILLRSIKLGNKTYTMHLYVSREWLPEQVLSTLPLDLNCVFSVFAESELWVAMKSNTVHDGRKAGKVEAKQNQQIWNRP